METPLHPKLPMHHEEANQAPATDPSPGRRVGPYRLVRELGRGGMGVVYEALHSEIGQRAAVKVLRPELGRDPDLVRRFFDEARAKSGVQHPGLVKVFDFGQLEEGTIYIVIFGILFIGMIVGFFVYLWMSDDKEPKDK